MAALKKIVLTGTQFYENIVRPVLGDVVPDQNYTNGLAGEFTVLDDVSSSAKVLDITPVSNILQRRDASCEIKYAPVASGGVRRIEVSELYGATKFCKQDFYQGALKDWRKGDTTFVTKILGFFKRAIKTDVISNMYFGDITRSESSTATYSTNKFDGILTFYRRYITAGAIPAGQTFNVPNGDITPANAQVYLKSLYDRQPEILRVGLPMDKAIYIDRPWYDAYEEYLIATGATNGEAVNYVQDGIKVRAFKGIPIFVNEFFAPVLGQISGAAAHFGVLTFRGNFIFATDKMYGEGPNGDQALVVWYDWDELTWKYLNVLKGGTQISAPELSSIALPA